MRSTFVSGAMALLVTTFAITACSVNQRAKAIRWALDAAPDCCRSLAELPFEAAMIHTRYAFTIDERSPAFSFPTGKSFFKGFALPVSLEPMVATIVSYAVVEQASLNQWTGHHFSPVVVYYDVSLKPSRPMESNGTFLFDGQGRRFSVLQVPMAPEARFMTVHADARLLETQVAVPVEYAARGTSVLTCTGSAQGTFEGRKDLADVASALCGLFAGSPVYAPGATSEWSASIPHAAGGELELWLMTPKKRQELPQTDR